MDKSILVVDDEPQILSALKRALRNQRYSVLFANDGGEALEILKQHEVALILSDYMMPGISGTELLTQAEKIQPNTIRIILSGHSDFQTVMQSIKEGVVHKFLAKPWSNDVLIDQINKALETGSYPADKKDETPLVKASSKQETFNKTYEIVLTDTFKITRIAPELAELFEYSDLTLCGEDLSTLFTAKSYQQHQAFLQEQDTHQDIWQLPAKKRIGQTQSNAYISLELAMKFSADEIICSITPIQGLAPKGKGLDSILDSIQGPFLLIDKHGKIRKFNQKLIDLYSEFHLPQTDEPLENFIQACIERGAFPEVDQNRQQWLDDFCLFDEESNEHLLKENAWIKVKATRAPEGAKILLHFDVTQKKKMQLSLKMALDDAEKAKKEKADVIESVHKNVTEPMKSEVLEPLEQLKGTDLNAKQQNFLDNAMESSSKILSNIEGITNSNSE
jgi:CheY-like chemotaxis protein